eukprot:4185045-Amphidinium_carterae.1
MELQRNAVDAGRCCYSTLMLQEKDTGNHATMAAMISGATFANGPVVPRGAGRTNPLPSPLKHSTIRVARSSWIGVRLATCEYCYSKGAWQVSVVIARHHHRQRLGGHTLCNLYW